MIWVYIAVGFVLFLVCIESFLWERKRQMSEEAEKAIISLEQCWRDVLRKADIYFVLPEENLWRFSLESALRISKDTLNMMHDILERGMGEKKYQIYKSVVAACQQSEKTLRNTFSSIEAFLLDEGPSHFSISKTGGLVESLE